MTEAKAETKGPRWLYLHGFASGPESSKGVALADNRPAFNIYATPKLLTDVTRAELSRMLAGMEGSGLAQAHAEELLAAATDAKDGEPA